MLEHDHYTGVLTEADLDRATTTRLTEKFEDIRGYDPELRTQSDGTLVIETAEQLNPRIHDNLEAALTDVFADDLGAAEDVVLNLLVSYPTARYEVCVD